MVLRDLDPMTGAGVLPDSDGVRDLVALGWLERDQWGTYLLRVPNPGATAEGPGKGPPDPVTRRQVTSPGISGPRWPVEALESRRPLHVKGRVRCAMS
jgi:hypothetical protein